MWRISKLKLIKIGKKNHDRARYLRNRSTGRNFIKKQATQEDLNELKELINGREEKLNGK